MDLYGRALPALSRRRPDTAATDRDGREASRCVATGDHGCDRARLRDRLSIHLLQASEPLRDLAPYSMRDAPKRPTTRARDHSSAQTTDSLSRTDERRWGRRGEVAAGSPPARPPATR